MWCSKEPLHQYKEISHSSEPLVNTLNGITVSGMMEKVSRVSTDILQIQLVYALLTFLEYVFFSEFISGVITVIIVKYS